jgi:hypothetical protein
MPHPSRTDTIREATIVDLVQTLLDGHANRGRDGKRGHIVEADTEAAADIDSTMVRDNAIYLELSNGQTFTITISEMA